jgi:hypothetical protein
VVPIVSDNRLTPEQLAQAIQEEEISFEDGLLYHMLNNLGISVEDPAFFMALSLAVGWANMGQLGETVDLPSGPATVAQIIEQFDLKAFLEN